jgi:hypothetical protein
MTTELDERPTHGDLSGGAGPRPSPRTGVRPREHAGAVPAARRVAAPLQPSGLVGAGGTPRVAAARKPLPDPVPLRLAIGLAGLATASALVSAFLSPSTGAAGSPVGGTAANGALETTTSGTSGAVRHITRYVQLLPGQTAPPNVVVQAAPTPEPRVVVVRTRQSGG